jgi:hypothetical protein
MVLPTDMARPWLQLADAPTAALSRASWVVQSHQDPTAFYSGLHALLRAQTPALRSRPGVGCELYFDLCLAGSPGEQAALRYRGAAGWESLSYRELARGAAILAARWQRAGAAAGQKLALLVGMGPELCLGLCAALQLGLVPTLIPPTGATFIQQRLRSSGCARVATTALLHQVLSRQPDWAAKLLPPMSQPLLGDELAAMHRYADPVPAAALFAPSHATPDLVVPLPAHLALWLAARDGLLGFRLRPGDCLAGAGLDLLQYQPTLLMATLLAGATYVELPLRELAADPRLVAAQPLRALLLSADGAAILGKGPRGLLAGVQALFVDAAHGASVDAWRATLSGAGELPPLYAMLYESAAGGCTMWSGRQLAHGPITLLPAPGVLMQVTRSGLGPGSAGYASVQVPATQPWARPLFVSTPAGSGYMGTVLPRRRGHTYPAAEVLKVIHSFPSVDAAVAVELPALPGSVDARVHLVVFTGPGADPELERQLAEALLRELPGSHQPDALVLIPFYARRKEGQPHADWVRQQYMEGRLQRKMADPSFYKLTALRAQARQLLATSLGVPR